MKKKIGILFFKELCSLRVILYQGDSFKEFYTLDDFVQTDFGCKGIQIYMTMREISAAYNYLKKEYADTHIIRQLKVYEKPIGFTFYKKDENISRAMTFYEMKYKIGADDFDIKDAYKIIKERKFKSWKQGFTSYLRSILKLDEGLLEDVIGPYAPSLTPIIYTQVGKDFENVFCYDNVSAYPYWLTQPLPHYVGQTTFTGEEMLQREDKTYYGCVKFTHLVAKNIKFEYYPLGISTDSKKQPRLYGENIYLRGTRIALAEEITLFGYLDEILEIVKRNYDFDSYEVAENILEFDLKIDEGLRKTVLEFFNDKQEKKHNEENNDGEKITLNRLYGFLITRGNNAPAHYGQYIVSRQRLSIDRLVHEIGLENVVQSHTDSIKFIGEENIKFIDKYNEQIEFKELGKLDDEGIFQKCHYFTNITGKYLNAKGEVGLKHGGYDKLGLAHLYKAKYEKITEESWFLGITDYYYSKEHGYCFTAVETNFKNPIKVNGADIS